MVLGNPDIKSKQAELLRKELDVAGIRLREFLPAWLRRKELSEAALRELLIALEAPIHEGHIPPYASIVVRPGTLLDRTIPLQSEEVELGRKAADGSSGLLVQYGSTPAGLMLLDPSAAPDLQLATMARELDGVVFRRERSGVVRVYSHGGALRHAGRKWSKSPALADAMETVMRAAPMLDRPTLARLLEFAYYVLSPWYIGATLIWLLTDVNPFAEGVNLRPLQLSLCPSEAQPSVAFAAHLLAQHDGATVISSHGLICQTGIHLRASEQAQRHIPPLPGTRHTSAQRASFDLGPVLIVTVSADGPVTVFSDGVNVLNWWWYSADKDAFGMNRALGSIVEDSVWADSWTKKCPNCGKTSTIEKLTVAGHRSSETAECPVCHMTIAEGHCFSIHANILKVL